MHTVESKFSNFVIEYLGELEPEFDNTLACAGAPDGFESWKLKIMVVENLMTHSLEVWIHTV